MVRRSILFLGAACCGLARTSGFVLPTSSRVTTRPRRSASKVILTKQSADKTVDREPSVIWAPTQLTHRALVVAALSALLLGPFALTFLPYWACLQWGLPSTSKIGNKASRISNGHRLGGVGTLVLPLVLAGWEVLRQSHPPLLLYGLAVATATTNLVLGATLITRRVPAYDIPTLRAFATGVLLGFSFLGSSLTFALGQYGWFKPVGLAFSTIAIYATIFACSDALQHARLFLLRSKHMSTTIDDNNRSISNDDIEPSSGNTLRRFWYLPFQRATWKDIFVTNLWRQPTPEALEATVSPANGVVVFTTSMTAVFACLGLLQLRYFFPMGGGSLALGPSGMAALQATEAVFCRWSTYQALLAVVANNFGTFAGTLVIQRRTSQKRAGLFNAIGLLIPVMNIFAFLVAHPAQAGRFSKLMLLPNPVA